MDRDKNMPENEPRNEVKSESTIELKNETRDERLASLKAAIRQETDQRQQATGETAGDGASAAGNSRAMSAGFRVATELVANVCVGGFIGWQLDKWIGTAPILLLVFLLLGVASGFWSVYRIAMRPTKPTATDRPL